MRVKNADAEAAAAGRSAAERERLACEVEALTEERRGHFFQVHELEAKLRRVQADSDEMREQVRRWHLIDLRWIKHKKQKHARGIVAHDVANAFSGVFWNSEDSCLVK